MITFEQARQIMLDFLAEVEADARKQAELRKDLTPKERETLGLGDDDDVPNLVILDQHTIAEDFGWVFFYQASDYRGAGDTKRKLAGNAPVIVGKNDGILHEMGTAEPVEVYIENFKRSGNPLG